MLLGKKKIVLNSDSGKNENGQFSISAVMIFSFIAIFRFGGVGAIFVGIVSIIASCRKQKTHQRWFNTALNAIDAGLSSLIYLSLNKSMDCSWPSSIFPVIATTFSYYLLNTLTVVTIIGLVSEQSIASVWRKNFLWTAPSYFVSATVGAGAALLLQNQLWALLLLVAPIAYFVQQLFTISQQQTRERAEHLAEIEVQQHRLTDMYLATIKSLALAIDAKDQYTHQHILRVQHYSIAVAEKVGLVGAEMEGLKTGALLHDIGKLGVPEYVLLKPGRLTPDEFDKIKKHPEIGAAILDPVDFPWPVLPVVKYHHEKWNGKGYPEGLRGEQIPLTARILAVADVYDALTSTRSYRGAWTHERAVELIRSESGEHFDPKIAAAFLEIIDDVVAQMALEGKGPLAPEQKLPAPITKSDEAARDIHRAASELWALYEVVQTLSASMGLDETLSILARKLEAILPGTACVFLLTQPDSAKLSVRAAVGLNSEHFRGCETLNSDSPSLGVLQSGETYLGAYDADDLLIHASPTTEWNVLQSAMIVPIIHQNKALGTINLYHSTASAFTDQDRNLLETIAERAAAAIFNGLLYDRVRSDAVTDPLTELYNLRFLTENIALRCADPEQKRFAILCLDLDSFKPVNDNFGHQRGDLVLQELAQLLCSSVRESDVVARYGGDEFLLILDGAAAAQAKEIGATIQEAVRAYDPNLLHPRLGALRIGASIGYACFPEDGNDYPALISKADARMYENKTERKLGRMTTMTTTDERIQRAA
jgi:diguanylate cyclase (GGDEF)-like protein/putative nucleotidyltransferase with HDIG domain